MTKFYTNTEPRTYGSSSPATATKLPDSVNRKKRDPRKIIRDILLVGESDTPCGPWLLLRADESAIAIRYLQKKIKRLEKGKKRKTMSEVIIDHLTAIGAEGLCDPENQCGCDIKDLFCCGNCPDECVPALRHTITQEDLEDENQNFCDPEVGDTVYRVMTEPKSSEKQGESK